MAGGGGYLINQYQKYSDEQLVEIIRSTNHDLYQEIIIRYQNKIRSYLYRLVGDREDAEDLSQEVFLKAYQNLQGFDLSKRFSPWIYRIAHNEAVNFLKKKSRFKLISIDASEFLQNTLGFSQKIEENIIKDEEIKNLKSNIDKLPIKYKEVIILKYFEEKSYEEISDILRLPVNTVGTLINRAKGKLKMSN